MEYNAVFGIDRAITVPYNATFRRSEAHYSNLYFGASLKALHILARRWGYELVGTNSAGNNAFFVRRDLLNERVRPSELEDAYTESKFRESRGKDGALTYISGKDRLNLIKWMPVINVETGEMEEL